MEKSQSQLELFTTAKESLAARANLPGYLFDFIRKYEKTVLLFICFIITGIISFSLGIEKGKRINLTPAKRNKEGPAVLEQPVLKKYTIQVASYKTKTGAQKEGQILREKGFLPLFFASREYTVVCVGNFPDKETAKTLVSELKKRYRDCFVRRL